MKLTPVWPAILLVLLAVVSAARAQNPARIAELQQKLQAQTKAYDEAKKKANERAAKRFDHGISKIRSASGLKNDVKLTRIKELESAKARFLKDGEWPENDDALGAGIEFGVALNKAYKPLAATYNQLIGEYLSADDRPHADEVLNEKIKRDRLFGGRDELRKGTSYRGTWTRPNDSTEIVLHVTKASDTTLNGRVDITPSVAGHPTFEIEEVLDGLEVKCELTKMIQGKARRMRFDGVLFGDRLVLGVTGVIDLNSKKPQPLTGFAVLTRKK